jgi:threonine dehydratase
MLTLDRFYHAAFSLKDVVRTTTLLPSLKLCPDSDLYLKTENLQVTGSFKVRGAYYKIKQLSAKEKEKGVICCSAGNHAQGVALAARNENIQSYICVPKGAPISKVEAAKSYGANVILVDGVYDDAFYHACELQRTQGNTFIHPFDDEDVITGQGTIALEILQQLPDPDCVIVPVGGGGLLSGIAFVIKSLHPDCKVYGVQAAGAPSMYNSLRQKNPVELPAVRTIADGIAVKKPGLITYDVCSKYVDDMVTVSDDEISSAILALIEQHKLITEGAGAVAVAAAMFGKVPIRGKKAVCLLSGGNIDVTILSRVITRGLLKAGRMATLTIALVDRPGELQGVSRIIAEHGGNVVSVLHDRNEEKLDINSCNLHVGIEARDHGHVREIRLALEEEGFNVTSCIPKECGPDACAL